MSLIVSATTIRALKLAEEFEKFLALNTPYDDLNIVSGYDYIHQKKTEVFFDFLNKSEKKIWGFTFKITDTTYEIERVYTRGDKLDPHTGFRALAHCTMQTRHLSVLELCELLIERGTTYFRVPDGKRS